MKSGRQCCNCGLQGHIAQFCNEETRTCYICYRRGHLARDCNNSSPQRIQCFRCQGFDHIARHCPQETHHFRPKSVKNSTTTKSRPLNSSYVAIPQRISETTAVSSTKSAQNGKGTLTKRKNGVNGVCLAKTGSNRRTNVEILPNELLLSLFGYLSTAHLLSAFHGLNSRIETLLFAHLRTCHLDFRLTSKNDIKIICKKYLRLIMDRIISVRLSDANHASKQTDLLSSYGLILHQFNNLRSLSLCYIHSEQMMNSMMIEWTYLPNLEHLKLIKCHSSFGPKGSTHLSNTIWSLPKLTHCYLDTEQYVFYMPTKISLSIEYVSIFGHCCSLNELASLLRKTPRLRNLSIRHRDLNDTQYFSSPISSVITLKLYDIHSRPMMMNLLQKMINLSHLSIETFYVNLDGDQWEQIIVHYLPKLRVFRLKMEIQFTDKKNNEQQIDILLDSFRTRFWLEEHQWFVQCHWKTQRSYTDILLYTLPLVFKNLNTTMMHSPCKSTRPRIHR